MEIKQQIRKSWIKHCHMKGNCCFTINKPSMLEFVFLIVEIEQKYGITFHAYEFRKIQKFNILHKKVRDKINEKQGKKM